MYIFAELSEGLTTSTGATSVTMVADSPETPREIRVDAIALELASGASVSQLAAKFGMTYGGMYALVQRDETKQRVVYYAKRIEDMKQVAQRKILLHTPMLLDSELAVALAGYNPDDGSVAVDVAAKPASQKARQYLIDKVLPTTSRVENTHETVDSAGQHELLSALRGVLDRVVQERTITVSDYSIADSAHVHEGTDALPSPLLEKLPT